MQEVANLPLEKVAVKFIPMKSARGHSFKACELSLEQLASKRFPLEKVTAHRFGLKDVDLAIKSVGGAGGPDVIHASLMPWERCPRPHPRSATHIEGGCPSIARKTRI